MGGDANRRSAERYFAAVRAHDFDTLDDLRHEGFVQEWPQMGERTRGKANARAINENHPGTPIPTVRRVTGDDDFWVAETTLEYPDGSVWQAVHLFEFRDGTILRQTDYFGAPLAAPAWREGWVERMDT